jgi:23S rRNA pseudouridine1911/1915/1917 synthase
MDEVCEFAVDPASASKRLDRFLAEVSGLSRARIQRLIEKGHALVNGTPKKPSYRLAPSERVLLTIPPPEPSGLSPEPIALSILYEDSELIVLDKPAGLVVHPAAGHRSGTLVNALLHHCPALVEAGEKGRPGIVHRLDKETSGVMVVAKTEAARLSLQKQFQARSVEKTYLALVYGEIREQAGKVEAPIGRHEEDRKRMGVRTRKGREAVTAYRVVERLRGFTLLEVLPETGRTHQIRVHLSAIGHPVVGDKLYGGKRERKRFMEKPQRQLLHAWKLSFSHPRTGERLAFEASLPDDIRRFIAERKQEIGRKLASQ